MIFDKLFPKKANEKAIKKFWKEFEERADLYANILQDDETDSDDYLWMMGMVRKSLKMCCLDTTVGYDFTFEKHREPPRLVFFNKNDDYLRSVGEKLLQYYPASLKNVIAFTVAE